MRILILCEHFEPSTDACSKRMNSIVDRLIQCGHDVQVLASETSLLDAESSFADKPYVRYYRTYCMDEKTVLKRLRNNLSEFLNSKKEACVLDRFDLIVVTTPPLLLTLSALSISKHSKARLVVDVRDIWPDVAYEMGSFRSGSIYGRVFEKIAQRAYARAALITTVTPGKVAKLCGKLPENEQGKVKLISNGIDLAFLEQKEDVGIVKQYMSDSKPTCVYIGNVGLAQGLSSLLRLATKYPGVRFLIFGGGAEEQLLEKKIREQKLENVCLCGKVSARGAFTILHHASCAYIPLVNSNLKDSIPTKLYEALACGCPVLLAACGDAVNLLEETGLGFSAAPEDEGGLAWAFGKILATDWSKSQKDAAANWVAAHHSRQAAACEFEKLLVARFGETCDVE